MSTRADLAAIELPPFDASDHVPSPGKSVRVAGSGRGVSAQINSGSLLVLDGALSDQNVADTSNSVLFSQLAADKLFDRKAKSGDWLNKFTNTLSTLGWGILSTTAGTSTAPMPVDWGDSLLSLLSRTARPLGETGIASARAAPSRSPAMKIWADAAVATDDGTLVLGPCQKAGGSPVLALAVIGFSIEVDVTGFLAWQAYRLNSTNIVCELNETVYATVRKTVTEKLGNRPSYLIADIPIA